MSPFSTIVRASYIYIFKIVIFLLDCKIAILETSGKTIFKVLRLISMSSDYFSGSKNQIQSAMQQDGIL